MTRFLTFLICAAALFALLVIGLISNRPTIRLPADPPPKLTVRNQCVDDMARRNPRQDVRADLAKGEDRFFIKAYYGLGSGHEVMGVEDCYPIVEFDSHSHALIRPLIQPNDFQKAFGGLDNDPALTVCGEAQLKYYEAYNANLVRVHPQSKRKYCSH